MRHLIPVVLLLAAGCASNPGVHWLKEDIHPVAVRGDRRLDRVRLWTHDGVLQWHSVLVTRDSISGIPDTVSPPCDSCRVTLPTSAVDSLHVGYRQDGPDNPFGSDLGLIALILLGLLVP
jgi:hypothetical protein